jgi:ABC-type spermidine/putrescine transport system permease subunit I
MVPHYIVVIAVGTLLVLALALGKVVLPSVVLNHHGPTDRIISQVLPVPAQQTICGSQNISLFPW